VTEQRGAYGVALDGPSAHLINDVPSSWPLWSVAHRRYDAVCSTVIGEHRARVALTPVGAMEINARARSIGFATPEPLPDEAFAHPYLAAAAAIVALWNGDQAFHGGAFVTARGAWLVLADPMAGKSSLVAAAHALGYPVIADDLLVVRDGAVMTGPRCIDLRPDVAGALGIGTSIGVAGARERWRVRLPKVAPQVRVAGFVTLAWADRLTLTAVTDPEARLVAHRAIVPREPDSDRIAALARLPMIEAARPRRLDDLRGSTAAILRSLA
jgi:hypothetical protein